MRSIDFKSWTQNEIYEIQWKKNGNRSMHRTYHKHYALVQLFTLSSQYPNRITNRKTHKTIFASPTLVSLSFLLKYYYSYQFTLVSQAIYFSLFCFFLFRLSISSLSLDIPDFTFLQFNEISNPILICVTSILNRNSEIKSENYFFSSKVIANKFPISWARTLGLSFEEPFVAINSTN